MLPQTKYYALEFGQNGPSERHPAATYVKKYRKFIEKGYSEKKALDLVETELTQVFEK